MPLRPQPPPHPHPATADPKIVKALHDHLIAAFEQFASDLVAADPSGEGLKYLDALMGCHNFYKAIILDLEDRTRDQAPPGFLRRTALATLQQALGVR